MAIPCLHKTITRKALAGAGFSDAAQANLRAMCGRSEGNMQTDGDCRRAVARRVADGRRQIAAFILDGDHQAALRTLGQILHTIQDRAFHNHEPWPYNGIADAIAGDPNYMLCHALRDLGAVSLLNLTKLHEGRFDLEVTQRIGRDVFLSGRVFADLGTQQLPGPRGRLDANEFYGTGGMLTLTFGAAPGSMRTGQPHRENEPPVWTLAMNGPAARARAEDETAEFVASLRSEVEKASGGQRLWMAFVQGSAPRN